MSRSGCNCTATWAVHVAVTAAPPALLLSVFDRDGFHALVSSAPLQRNTVGAIKDEDIWRTACAFILDIVAAVFLGPTTARLRLM